MFSYAPLSKLSQPKVAPLDYVVSTGMGNTRTLPAGVTTPVPSVRTIPVRTRELPMAVGVAGEAGRPAVAPVNAPTLEPVSHL